MNPHRTIYTTLPHTLFGESSGTAYAAELNNTTEKIGGDAKY